MRTETTRRQYGREGLHYASDATDQEWALMEAELPPAKTLGRPRTTALREVVNALLYMLTTGCQGRQLPKEFPPYSTVQRFFYCSRDDGLWQRINHRLLMRVREASGREASPSAGVIDSQSVKTTEAGGPRGYDAGKQINGRKRHLLTDTLGLPVTAVVHPANVQDRDGAPLVLAGRSPEISAPPEQRQLRHASAPKWRCAVSGHPTLTNAVLASQLSTSVISRDHSVME